MFSMLYNKYRAKPLGTTMDTGGEVKNSPLDRSWYRLSQEEDSLIWGGTVSTSCHDFPTIRDCALKLQARINPCFYIGYLVTEMRKVTKTVTKHQKQLTTPWLCILLGTFMMGQGEPLGMLGSGTHQGSLAWHSSPSLSWETSRIAGSTFNPAIHFWLSCYETKHKPHQSIWLSVFGVDIEANDS